MNKSTDKSLLDLVNESASAARINTVDNALAGFGLGQKNFKGKWRGYELNNRPTVNVNGKLFNTRADGFSGLPMNAEVTVRAGKDILSASWR